MGDFYSLLSEPLANTVQFSPHTHRSQQEALVPGTGQLPVPPSHTAEVAGALTSSLSWKCCPHVPIQKPGKSQWRITREADVKHSHWEIISWGWKVPAGADHLQKEYQMQGWPKGNWPWLTWAPRHLHLRKRNLIPHACWAALHKAVHFPCKTSNATNPRLGAVPGLL